MGKVLYMRKGAPKPTHYTGVELGAISEGSIVRLNENGSPVEFYVAKHDYESGLNGPGCTLLVRKDCYDYRLWDSTRRSMYVVSDIDLWLNGEYKKLLDPIVQEAINETRIVCTKGFGFTDLNTASRAVFLLSGAELGKVASYVNPEGSALPIASTLQTALYNGASANFWTRSPMAAPTNEAGVWVQQSSNNTLTYFSSSTATAGASRPCMTLPATALFDENTMAFKGVV